MRSFSSHCMGCHVSYDNGWTCEYRARISLKELTVFQLILDSFRSVFFIPSLLFLSPCPAGGPIKFINTHTKSLTMLFFPPSRFSWGCWALSYYLHWLLARKWSPLEHDQLTNWSKWLVWFCSRGVNQGSTDKSHRSQTDRYCFQLIKLSNLR